MHHKLEFWIITSTEDRASMNIRTYLLNNYPFYRVEDEKERWMSWESNPTYLLKNDGSIGNIRLVVTNKPMILLGEKIPKKDISDFIGADFAIFASRHKAQSELPALLCHSTGNWSSDISFGGEPRSLCRTSARLVKLAFQNLEKHRDVNIPEWPVDLEVNHHGPTQFEFPLIFMELGSSEEFWDHTRGGKVVADAIMDTAQSFLHEIPVIMSDLPKDFSREVLYLHIRENEKKSQNVYAIGYGGVHYARTFSKLLDRVAISFIIPKYFVPELAEDLIWQMIDHTLEPVNYALIDWNSMNSATRVELSALLGKMSIPWKKTKEIK